MSVSTAHFCFSPFGPISAVPGKYGMDAKYCVEMLEVLNDYTFLWRKCTISSGVAQGRTNADHPNAVRE